MKSYRSPFAAASLAALFALSACNNEPKTVTDVEPDPQAAALNQAKPVTPPRMIQASRTYRCKDNSLVYVDFYTDNSAQARTTKEGTGTLLNSNNGQPPYTAEGWSVSGNAPQVTIAAPGKGSQSCKA